MTFDNSNFKLLTIVFVILIIGGLFSCSDDPCFKYYQVEYPFKMYSKADTIDIGDTIFLDIAIANPFTNVMSGESIELPPELIEHFIYMTFIDKDSIVLQSIYRTGACSLFSFVCLKGNLENDFGNWFYPMEYIKQGDSLFGQFAFIANNSGTFVFHLSDYAFDKYEPDPLEDYNISLGEAECYEYYWQGLFINNKQDNNFYIIKDHSIHFDTTSFKYWDRNDSNYDKVNDHNPNNKNYPNDMKQNLKYGTYSFVVR